MYLDSYFEPWVRATATVVSVDRVKRQHSNSIEYCPIIQFDIVSEAYPTNITAVLEDDCDEDFKGVLAVGSKVAIRYDPSEPTDVINADVPAGIDAIMTIVIAITACCSCCYVAIGVFFYKASKKSMNNTNNGAGAINGEPQPSYSYENNNTPSSIPMTNLGGNSAQYTDPNGYSINSRYTSSEPVETTASAVFVSPDAEQPISAPSIVYALPEGTTANTGIAAGEEPPMVGCTLISADNNTSIVSQQSSSRPLGGSQTYVSPNDLPLNPVAPTSSYVSPSDIREARATLDREYQ